MKILFVCLGNICRSPLAEAAFTELVRQEGLTAHFEVDSAGTAGWHAGELADPRARATAQRHGFALTHRSRPVVSQDFDAFDLIVAMDQKNFHDLKKMAGNAMSKAKVHLFREWDSAGLGDIPDPYYGQEADFEMVWHLCERASRGLLAALQRK